MSGARAARTAQSELEKGRVEVSKVKRYWASKAPEWAQEAEDDDVVVEPREVARTAIAEPVVVVKKADRRLDRLSQYQQADADAALARRRQIREPEIVARATEHAEPAAAADELRRRSSDAEPMRDQAGSEEDEEELERRRAERRERLLRQRQEEELLAQQRLEADAALSGEETSEYETESEDDDNDDDGGGGRMIKPVFVPKKQRETIDERKQIELEEELEREREKKRLEERKVETKELVSEIVKVEQEREKNHVQGPLALEDVDTDDDADEDAEYEAWRGREMKRMILEKEARDKHKRELELREKLRNMTEEERKEWERQNPKEFEKAPKKKWKFLQKYWHKGAFFQEAPDDIRASEGGDGIFKRDFSAPVGEDKFDKSILPKVMQVRNFGRSGRTKWTHLVAEDTTKWEDPWFQSNSMRQKYNQKMAGMAQTLDKPKNLKT